MSERGDALRLAIYLDTVGLVPECRQYRTWDDVVAALSLQFFALPSEVRRAAKAHAGRIVSDGGLVALGRAILPDHPLFNPGVDHSCLPPRPKCDHCQKATWNTREAALEFCSTADLEPFCCPADEGKWHIAGKRDASRDGGNKVPAFPPRPSHREPSPAPATGRIDAGTFCAAPRCIRSILRPLSCETAPSSARAASTTLGLKPTTSRRKTNHPTTAEIRP